MTFSINRITLVSLATAILLLIPFIAMQFTEEVHWGPMDFLVAGVLLFGAGLLADLAIRQTSNIYFRIAIIFALLAGLVLVWGELAVGLFGTPLAGN